MKKLGDTKEYLMYFTRHLHSLSFPCKKCPRCFEQGPKKVHLNFELYGSSLNGKTNITV